MKWLFKKEFSLNRVRDMITIREGNETLPLYVDSDANMLIKRLRTAQKAIDEAATSDSEEERQKAAIGLSEAMFGDEQTHKLLEFYHGDYGCVITICGMYFGDAKKGLGKKITKAQKRNR